ATSGKLYAIARRMLRRADGASDALQEAYVRIWTQSAQYDAEKGQPIHRMAAIARHVCIDMLRRSASQPMSGLDLETIEEALPPDDSTSSLSTAAAARSGAVQGDPDGFPLWLVACRACQNVCRPPRHDEADNPARAR